MTDDLRHSFPRQASGGAKLWTCGTLQYTRTGLVLLFVFLLWGDFCFVFMQQVVPSILPLKLKSLGASNIIIGVLLSSIFPVFGIFISPYLSFKSDRFRSKWGRRIPFIAISLPFLCGSIVLLAYSENIAAFMHRIGPLSGFSLATAKIIIVGICVVAFQFADVLVCSVFNYIFNDTVPVPVLGRFVGLMKVIGGAVGFLYNYFLFKFAESHMQEIFLATALIYLLGIGMMCLKVKEGEYPPVTDYGKTKVSGWNAFKTYFQESFSHRIYWIKYLCMASGAMALWAMAPFNIFFYREMGLSLDQVGKAAAIVSVAGIAAAYFAAVFIDRWHPLRIMAYSSIFAVIFTASNWVWLFVTLPAEAFFWLHMLGAGLIGAFHGMLSALAVMPLDMRLLPKSRFGQFSSAQSILVNGTRVAAGFLLGLFFDALKWLYDGSDYIYRYSFAWTSLWLLVAAALNYCLYRMWRNLGGDLHFHPPASWSASGYEKMEGAPFAGTQSKWLRLALALLHGLMALSILYLIPVAFWLWKLHWDADFFWHLFGIIPGAIALYVVWIKVEQCILNDLSRAKLGESPKLGLPHHGVILVKAGALFLLLGVWVGKTIMAIHDGLQNAVLVLGCGNLVTNLLVIAVILVLCRMEKGFDPMLDRNRSPNCI